MSRSKPITTGVRWGRTGLPVVDLDDVHAGFPFGRAPASESDGPVANDPHRALRAALLPALVRPPCVIAFSGGRDSSLLLAVAADLAASEGLDPPVAYTLRYPGDPAAEESAWQDLTLDHLRGRGLLPEWVRRDIDTELDLVGPLVAPVLREHAGPTFPPALGSTILLTGVASGGSLVTGNFGDEVLAGHRSAVLRAFWRRRGRGLSRADWAGTAFAAAPVRARRRAVRREDEGHPWLRPPLRARVAERHADDAAARPLCWDASVRAALATRAVHLGRLTREKIARDNDCTLVEPLGSPSFVESFARFGGRWGGLSRGAATRMLAGGLIPEEIISRKHKAYFNRSRFGRHSRRFAASWDGRGVDDELVDPDVLRRAWSADVPQAASAMLLQLAWLAQNGDPR